MKPKSENIQRNISTRLNQIKDSLPTEDFQFLWEQTHELYEYARSLEQRDSKMIAEIRNQNQLMPFADAFKMYWREVHGDEIWGESLHWIYDFALFMAEKKDYTFQPAINPIKSFTPDLE